MKLSVSFFGSGQEGASVSQRYETVLRLGRLADELGFHALWVPERHFQDFGDLFPNPAVLAGALAAVTQQIRINAGSVVLPLHHDIRVLEDWSMLDGISGGRVGVSVATGWNPLDFMLAPDAFADRRRIASDQLLKLRQGWRTGAVSGLTGAGADGRAQVRPHRIQAELPLWLTTSGRPETWTSAGALGVSVLASTIGQSTQTLADNIAKYRAGFTPATPGAAPQVTLVVHTYVGADRAVVRTRIEPLMKRYLSSFLDQSTPDTRPDETLREQLLEFAFERYWSSMSLLGTTDSCARTLAELAELGCDEVACLLDFGPTPAEMETTMRLLAPSQAG